ncbi:hypothetical protein SNA_34820 [Streptomyces natalensis ATCC 27448]|uniref:Uncharacterized protein n=2 Tax=Streptomyces natalensis TaxID=68242 RepID=A0A0D7CE50_9ACTN|nr:hypothetical protein SNA_34820 [Streptomyces natalensis ATCC 27448]
MPRAGSLVSAALLLPSNLALGYLLFLAVAASPDGPWDEAESAATVQVVSLLSGALALAVALLTLFILATQWLRSRWWLAVPGLVLAGSVIRWLFPSA